MIMRAAWTMGRLERATARARARSERRNDRWLQALGDGAPPAVLRDRERSWEQAHHRWWLLCKTVPRP